MNFINPTKGKMSISRMVQDIVAFMEEDTSAEYKLIVGTDSQSGENTCFVTAVIIHRVGRGARYYYYRKYIPHVRSLRHKIFTETSMSLDAVTRLKEEMIKTRYKDIDMEIHVDIGQNGDTKELIREVVGWVMGMGNGYKVKIKPDACGASKVADRYTK